MTPATQAVQRPADARLLRIDARGRLDHHKRHTLPALLAPGDLLVANDAATLPASLHGVHGRTGRPIEVRLAGRPTLAVDAVKEFAAVVFGEGDHRTRTEDRPSPPPLQPDDLLLFGCGTDVLRARVKTLLGHARLVQIRFDGTPESIWRGLARHGKPVQYAHLAEPLALWDSWTRIAAQPVAFEPPSAGFLLDWAMLDALRARGIGFATLTHAAGLSSTGDEALDARLPLPEPYHLPAATVAAIERTRRDGGRVVALGTTVTRALEHAAWTGRCAPAKRWPTTGSVPAACCAWSTRWSAARTSPAPATTGCCAHSPARRRWTGWTPRSRSAATAATSTAIRCCCGAPRVPVPKVTPPASGPAQRAERTARLASSDYKRNQGRMPTQPF